MIKETYIKNTDFVQLKNTMLKKFGNDYGKITRNSLKWFYQNISKINTINAGVLPTLGKVSSNYIQGRMFMFNYYPKTIDKLSYYDAFPLIFII
jgi:hypothetical protein